MKPRLVLALLVGAALVVGAIAAGGEPPVPYATPGPVDTDVPTTTPSTPRSDLEGVAASDPGGSLVAVFLVLIVAALIVVAGLITTLRLPRWRRRGVGAVADTAEAEAGSAPE